MFSRAAIHLQSWHCSEQQRSQSFILSAFLKPPAKPVPLGFVAIGWVNSYFLSLLFISLSSQTAVVSKKRSSRVQTIPGLHLLPWVCKGIAQRSLRHENPALLSQRQPFIGCKQGLPNLRWKDQTLIQEIKSMHEQMKKQTNWDDVREVTHSTNSPLARQKTSLKNEFPSGLLPPKAIT